MKAAGRPREASDCSGEEGGTMNHGYPLVIFLRRSPLRRETGHHWTCESSEAFKGTKLQDVFLPSAFAPAEEVGSTHSN